MMKYYYFLFLLVRVSGFLKLPLGSPFSIKNIEYKHKISTDHLSEADLAIVQEISGVYGLIGPDFVGNDVENLYQLFTGNGIIQGCFFDKGEVTFVNHYVRTEKLIYEEQCGQVLKHKYLYLLFFLLNKIHCLPNVLGFANTALVNMGKKHYALYERDVPYEILFDFDNKSITTGQKQHIHGLNFFSAHPVIYDDKVETIQYNVFRKTVSFLQLTTDLVVQKHIETPMTYLPVVHDFISTRYNYIVFDSPLAFKFSDIFTKKIPISLMENKPTFIRIVNKFTGRVRTFEIPEGVFVFHFAQMYDDEHVIRILASCYDTLDFSTVDIQGKYRMLVLDKFSGKVSVKKHDRLENLNLDFPVRYDNMIILRNIHNRVCNGFVVCRDLEIVHEIYFFQRFVCGEPRVIYLKGSPYLIFFTFNISSQREQGQRGEAPQQLNSKSATRAENFGHIVVLNLRDFTHIDLPLDFAVQFGFHSFFFT